MMPMRKTTTAFKKTLCLLGVLGLLTAGFSIQCRRVVWIDYHLNAALNASDRKTAIAELRETLNYLGRPFTDLRKSENLNLLPRFEAELCFAIFTLEIHSGEISVYEHKMLHRIVKPDAEQLRAAVLAAVERMKNRILLMRWSSHHPG